MELSSKWDSLDTNTQRYIATIAAGSRQQSRFIAMMSDYGRTQELVAEAQNSAGASNKQFGKTLESLESKINQLRNAWDEFTTGILNSDLVKYFVDVLTKILTTINNVTKGFGSFTQSISKIGMIVSIFKVAKSVLDAFSKYIKDNFTTLGEHIGKSISDGITNGLEEGTSNAKQKINATTKDTGNKTNTSNTSTPTTEVS
jgi:hypothetical protein